jgi:hypothetical protein
MSVEHPITPEIQWRIAISRRFTSSYVQKIYEEVIYPVISEEDLVLECYYAEEMPDSQDYWVHRMNLILELADIYILIDIEPTVYTKAEIRKAWLEKNSVLRPALSRFLGAPYYIIARDLYKQQLIIIKESKDKPYASEKARHSIIYFSPNQDFADFQKLLKQQIQRAKRAKSKGIIRQQKYFYYGRAFKDLQFSRFLNFKWKQLPDDIKTSELFQAVKESLPFYDSIAKLINYGYSVEEIQWVIDVSKILDISISATLDIIQNSEDADKEIEALISAQSSYQSPEAKETDDLRDTEDNFEEDLTRNTNLHHAFNLQMREEDLISPKGYRELYLIYKTHYLEKFGDILNDKLKVPVNKNILMKILIFYCAWGRTFETKYVNRHLRK